MKRYIYLLLFVFQSVYANGETINVIAEGSCGANLAWKLTNDSILYISGDGNMADYSDQTLAPWQQHNAQIKKIVVQDGITNIGKYAFMDCSSMEEIELPEGITSIGIWAFYNCYALKQINIPASVVKIESPAFMYCI